MADNVAITAGTGTTVHADEYTHSTLGSGKTQLVKLVDGTLDSSTAIAAGGGVEAGALRVTLASDSTGVVSVDDNGGALTVDGTVAVTNADIGTIAGAVAGTEMQVDIVGALPAGTNAIGTLAANSGVDIGDVTINNATIAVTQSGTWDEVGINDSGNSITVDNGGTFAVQAATTIADGAAVTLGAKADDKSPATDTTAVSVMSVLKQISASVQAPPSQAVTNAGTFAVQAAATLAAETSKVIGTINVAASQTIGVTQATAGNLNCTEASAAAIKTAVETIDNAISGSEMQVDVVGALPAGTNTIGAVKSVPSDIDINGSNANHADKYYTNAGAVTDGIVWSPAAGKRWHILTLYIQVSAATTVTLEDDLAGGDAARWKAELAANSGVVLTYDKEHPFCSGEDAADLIITTTAGNVYVQAVGYEV